MTALILGKQPSCIIKIFYPKNFDTIRLYALAYPVTVLGPGQRVILWVAGCQLNCLNCLAPELHPQDAGRELRITRLASRLLALQFPLAGLTLSGGEPFDQSASLAKLLDQVLPQRPDWDVIAYSGYPLETLRRKEAALLAKVDILVDGPYRSNIPQNHPLAGSGNQQVHALTERGQALLPVCAALPDGRLELGLGTGNQGLLIGVAAK
ncbi:anaerobic ribonucleoside-triphosphate reductase activating protein [Gammaproteobacteria bacterium]